MSSAARAMRRSRRFARICPSALDVSIWVPTWAAAGTAWTSAARARAAVTARVRSLITSLSSCLGGLLLVLEVLGDLRGMVVPDEPLPVRLLQVDPRDPPMQPLREAA